METKLVENTFNNAFNPTQYEKFLTELLNKPVKLENEISNIDSGFKNYINKIQDYGTFTDDENDELKLYVVELKKTSQVERARTMQRNLIGKLLTQEGISNALVAFHETIEGEREHMKKIGDFQ